MKTIVLTVVFLCALISAMILTWMESWGALFPYAVMVACYYILYRDREAEEMNDSSTLHNDSEDEGFYR